jgi:hypothetical protein
MKMPEQNALSAAHGNTAKRVRQGFLGVLERLFLAGSGKEQVRPEIRYLPFWILAASTSFKAQIAAFFGATGSFRFVISTELLPIPSENIKTPGSSKTGQRDGYPIF